MRNTPSCKTVCEGCGSEWNNTLEWLDEDPCMPDRGLKNE